MNKFLAFLAILLQPAFLSYTSSASDLNFINEQVFGAEDTTKRSIEEKVAYINGLYEKVTQESRFSDILDAGISYDLPRGIKKTIGGREYVIIIDSMKLTPTGAYFNAHCVLELPWNGNRVYFSANKIEFHPGGLTGKFNLNLVRKEKIPFGKNNLYILPDLSATYVQFGCEGFQSFGIKAEYEFSSEILIPEYPDGTPNLNGTVKAGFQVQGSDLSDIIVGVSISPFQVKGLDDFGFYVQDALLDFSDLNNPAGITFPNDYAPILASYGIPSLWQGFYLREAIVKIPKQYKSDNNLRTEIGVQHLIIDHHGITGNFFGKNLISIEKGNLGGWAFSLDSLGVHVLANQLRGAGFNGQLQIPITKEDKYFAYTGFIAEHSNYHFSVTTNSKIDVPLWVAQAEIYEGSSIEVTIVNKEFRPKAILHGRMDINASFSKDKGSGTTLAGLSFEYLTIQTIAPYISAQRFGLDEIGEGGKTNLSNFPISLKSVAFVSEGDKVGIAVGIAVNLSKSDDKGFAGEAGLRVMGVMVEAGDRQKWKYDNVYLDKIKINIDNDAFKLRGELDIYRSDSIYGKGFKGMLDAWFKPGIAVGVTAQFGNVDGFRYWYVDAKAILPTGMPIFTGFGVYGFIGGAYYKMRQNTTAMVQATPGSPVNASDNSDMSGISLSGAVYVPDVNVGLGLKAGVIVGTMPKPDPFNGDVTFEIQFNPHGGVNFIGFQGNAYVMTAMEKRDGSAPIYASIGMYFDFPNSTLHANMEVFVNAGIVKGIGESNRAGWCVLHFAPQDWYVHVGVPDNRVGLNLFGAIKVGGYFMAGTEIPGFPSPPAIVGDILGEADLNMMRDENALGSGKGFAFGASIACSTGEKNFLIFYGSFDAGMGFDIMMKNYGSNVSCAGRSEPLGMKGWYASGQLYSYVQGAIGVKAKVFGKEKKVEILSIGVAAILQAKLPNPTWVQGIVGGRYSVLGGLVSGNCKFKLTIGEECQMVGGSVLASIKVIEEITPAEGSSNVSVFNSPQALFNIPVDKTFELMDYDGVTKYFRARLESMKIYDGSTELRGNADGNSTKDVFAFNSHDILPPEKTLRVKVNIVFEEWSGNAWRPVIVDGKIQGESKEASFRTGTAPDHIPASNVAYSYPVMNQFNYFKSEHGLNYVTLIKGQPYLFDSEGGKWRQEGRVTIAGEGRSTSIAISYDGEKKQVNFSIPQSIENNTVYNLQFLRVPARANADVDANVTTVLNTTEDESGTVEIASKTAQGSRENLQEKEIFGSLFRTSVYNTFNEKMQTFNFSQGGTWPIANGVHELTTSFKTDELFDKLEIQGKEGMKPLIGFKALLGDSYYRETIYPLNYLGYPIHPQVQITNWRNTEEMGVPPVNGIFIGQSERDRMLLEANKNSSDAPGFSGSGTLVYFQPYYYYMDYHELKQKSAEVAFYSGSTPRLETLINGRFPSIQSGKYDLEMSYVLPGINTVTSTFKVVINLKE